MGQEGLGGDGFVDFGKELEEELAQVEIPKRPAYNPEGTVTDIDKFKKANAWAMARGVTVKGQELLDLYDAAHAKDDLGSIAA